MGCFPFTWKGQPFVQPAGRARRLGDILLSTVVGQNNGSEAARNRVLTDLIPASTHFVAGTLQVVSSANAGARTGAAGDEHARATPPAIGP
jgi:uncharacterized repeat protein (TIGR01451 family)